MENAVYIGLSQQMALRRELDLVANNVANMNTTGFKAQRTLFLEYATHLAQPGASDAGGENDFSFVNDYGSVRDLKPGPLQPTGNPLDLAIQGKGYFTVRGPDGDFYTRAGAFQLGPDGKIVDGNGYPLLSASGTEITIPAGETEISISGDGTVSAGTANLGRIGLVEFQREHFLEEAGNALYKTDEDPTPSPESRIAQGMLEQSNVQPVLEITRMIDVLRSYQAAQKLMEDEDARMRKTIDVVMKTTPS
jgi:flagellar basal-body rod protein FlgF